VYFAFVTTLEGRKLLPVGRSAGAEGWLNRIILLPAIVSADATATPLRWGEGCELPESIPLPFADVLPAQKVRWSAMHMEEIIFSIDAEIDRLQRARNVLAGAPPPAKRKRRRKARAAVPAATVAQPVVDARSEPEVPRVIRYAARPPRQPRSNRPARLKREEPGKKTALASAIPIGPVAVSAEEARQAQARWDRSQLPPRIEIEVPPAGERTLGSLIARLGSLAGGIAPSPQVGHSEEVL
jgi:hypothetical protein